MGLGVADLFGEGVVSSWAEEGKGGERKGTDFDLEEVLRWPVDLVESLFSRFGHGLHGLVGWMGSG